MQVSGIKKAYSIEELCPYPFDQSVYMPPFPQHFNIPNFKKYKGKGDPVEHVREFHTACMDFAFDHTYLMILFPHRLLGKALEWFTHLTLGIRTWNELADKFVIHFSYNIKSDMTLAKFSTTKQK